MQWLLWLLYRLIGEYIWANLGGMHWIYDTGASWDVERGVCKETGSLEGGVVGEYCVRSIGPLHIRNDDHSNVLTIKIGG